MKTVKGFKASENMVCRSYKYTTGKTHTMVGRPIICERGFHFCRNAKDVLSYYSITDNFVLMEVEALGDIDEKGDKCATNQLKVVRRLTPDEAAKALNMVRTTVEGMIQKTKLPKAYRDLTALRFKQAVSKGTTLSGYESRTKKYFFEKEESWGRQVVNDTFLWRSTPEGQNFWDNVNCASKTADLPDIPAASLVELKKHLQNKKNKKKSI